MLAAKAPTDNSTAELEDGWAKRQIISNVTKLSLGDIFQTGENPFGTLGPKI